MAVFNIDNLISLSLLKQVGEIDNTTVNPTVQLSPVSALKFQTDNTPGNDVLITEILLTMSANVVDSNGDLQAERMWLTGGVEKTLTDGSIVAEYTATVRGIFNGNKTNEPLSTNGGTRNYLTHKNGARCVVDWSWLMRNLGSTFTAASSTTTSIAAGEAIAVRRAVSQDTSDSKFYNYQSGKTGFIGISDQAMVAATSYSIPTFGNLVTGFTGLTPSGTVYADFVVAPSSAATSALAGSGAGNVDNGAHDYVYTFVTAQGETIGGTASNSTTVADKSVDGQISLTGIGVSSNANVTSRKVYRRFNAAGTYKLLTTIADNVTTIFTDNVANSSLGADVQTTTTNDGLITQVSTATSTPIGTAEGSTAVKILAFAPAVTVFKDGELQVINTADASKILDTDISGSTTGKTTTLATSSTVDRTLTLPDATDTLATQGYADNAASGSNLVSVVAAETLAQGDAVYIDKPTTFVLATSVSATLTDVGFDATKEKIAVPIIGNGVSASSLKVALKKVGSPTDNIDVRIETDSAGAPSGTLADVNATKSTAGTGLTTSYVDTTITFPGAFTLTAATKYWIVFERDGSLSGTNYFRVGAEATRNTFYTTYQLVSSTWTARTSTTYFSAYAGASADIAKKTQANKGDQTQFFGFADTAITALNAGNYDVEGVSNTQSGLTFGAAQYLSNTAGAISETPGTNTIFVGTALSATAVSIRSKQFPITTVDVVKSADQIITSGLPVNIVFGGSGDGLKRELTTNVLFTARGSGQRKFIYTMTVQMPNETTARGGLFEMQLNGTAVRVIDIQAADTTAANSQSTMTGIWEGWVEDGDTMQLVMLSSVPNNLTFIGTTGSSRGESSFQVIEYQ